MPENRMTISATTRMAAGISTRWPSARSRAAAQGRLTAAGAPASANTSPVCVIATLMTGSRRIAPAGPRPVRRTFLSSR
ncbi:hypothetical protein G6F45_014133 [Rhizopus arrhizus]|nr:hypothetical protein G6F45_014133 [Rhizopus arrhizus]